MKVLVSACLAGEGFSGYCAVMEWSSVQEERPSCATSGGQSVGSAGRFLVVVPLVMAKSEDTSVQVRHLHCGSSSVSMLPMYAGREGPRRSTSWYSRFAIGTQNNAFGKFGHGLCFRVLCLLWLYRSRRHLFVLQTSVRDVEIDCSIAML